MKCGVNSMSVDDKERKIYDKETDRKFFKMNFLTTHLLAFSCYISSREIKEFAYLKKNNCIFA